MKNNVIKWLLVFLVAIFISISATGQTAIITGNANVISGPTTNPISLQVQLVSCANNTPLVNGTSLLNPLTQTFTASGGVVTGALYGNDIILCGTQKYSLYAVTWLSNGQPVSPTAQYRLTEGQTCNISNGTCKPVGFVPAQIGKSAGAYCPVGQLISGFKFDYSIICSVVTNSIINFSAVVNALGYTPLSGNEVLFKGSAFADYVSAADEGAKINASFALFQPVLGYGSAEVNLNTNGYYLSATGITLPGNVSSPSNNSAVLDCHGSIFRHTGSGPLITALPANNLGAGTGSGIVRNCYFIQEDSTTANVKIIDRMGLTFENVTIQGGLDGIELLSTAYAGVNYNYLEENHFDRVNFIDCHRYGINYTTTAGGTGSHLYNKWKAKFDLNPTCTTALHIGAGSSAQGNDFDFTFNIGGGSNAFHLITNDGELVGASISIYGEVTGGATGTIYRIDGSAYSHPVVYDYARFVSPGGYVDGPNTMARNPTGCASDEGYFLGRVGISCPNQSNAFFYLANNGGTEDNTGFRIWRAFTNGSSSRATEVPSDNIFYASSLGNTFFGPGYGSDRNAPSYPDHSSPYNINTHSLLIAPNVPISGGTHPSKGWFDLGGGNLAEFVRGTTLTYSHVNDDNTTLKTGSAFTGACSYTAGAAVTFQVVDGHITGCS